MQILIRILSVLSKGEKGLSVLEGLTKLLGGNTGKLIKTIRGLSANQEKMLIKKYGKNSLDAVKKSISPDKKKNQSIKKTYVKSSWIEYVSWSAVLGVLTLKTKKNVKIYKLPFCPRSVALKITTGKSPGKALWNGYWRVFGKGSVNNKLNNKARVTSAKKTVRLMPRVPGIPKLRVSTKNIPYTAAKGIKISIKQPKLKRRK